MPPQSLPPGGASDKDASPPAKDRAPWASLGAGLVFLVVVIVFVLENLQDVKVTFFGAHWTIPLGLDLLLAAVLGAAVVFFAGAVRLLQSRLRARRRSGHKPTVGSKGEDRQAGSLH